MSKKLKKDLNLFWKGDIEYHNIEIHLLPDKSTQNAYTKFSDDCTKIYIGMIDDFSDVIENVLHELQELWMFDHGKRYANTKEPDLFSMVDCMFIINHLEFQKMNYFVARIICEIFPKLFEAWKNINEIEEELDEKEEINKE